MKRAERQKLREDREASEQRLSAKRERLSTRNGIAEDCQAWGRDFEIDKPDWMSDCQIFGYSGQQKDGLWRIHYFAYVDVPNHGLEILQINKFVTDMECKAAAGSNVSPFLLASADAYRSMQDGVSQARLGVLP